MACYVGHSGNYAEYRQTGVVGDEHERLG